MWCVQDGSAGQRYVWFGRHRLRAVSCVVWVGSARQASGVSDAVYYKVGTVASDKEGRRDQR